MLTRIIVFGLFILVLAAPFLFRPAVDPPPQDARRLIIITPHNEQIRTEFAAAFNLWHQEMHGEAVNVIYNVPGGTSEIRKMLESQFEAALERGIEPGGAADLVFGGGSYEHTVLKRGVDVDVNGEVKNVSITVPVEFDSAWLRAIYGENDVGGTPLYDPELYWFGTALSGFGIVYKVMEGLRAAVRRFSAVAGRPARGRRRLGSLDARAVAEGVARLLDRLVGR